MTRRGSGQTSQEIAMAPRGGIFIIHSHSFLPYVKTLANKLGRSDLQIIPLSKLLDESFWCGRKLSNIVFDHAVWNYITIKQKCELKKVLDYQRMKNLN